MLSDQNGIRSKYQLGYFDDLHELLTLYLMSMPENGEFILLSKGFCFCFFLLNLLTFIEILSRITSTLPYENE